MEMRQGVGTGIGHGDITCVLLTQFSSLLCFSKRICVVIINPLPSLIRSNNMFNGKVSSTILS